MIVIVVNFFLFASFSFFVESVDKLALLVAGQRVEKECMLFPGLWAMNSCYVASWDGLGHDCFAWASGKLPLAVWTDLRNFGALLAAAAANQPQLWNPDRPRQHAGPAHRPHDAATTRLKGGWYDARK